MTYGWAILIIAVVLGAMFSLGVFSSATFSPTTCISTSTFLCLHPLLHGGQFTATVGQSSGQDWQSANIFVQSQGNGAPIGIPACNDGLPNGLFNEQSINIALTEYVLPGTLTCQSFPNTPGQSVSGTVWAAYTLRNNANTLYSQMGTVVLKDA